MTESHAEPGTAPVPALRPVTTRIEPGRLAFFAKAIGETDPVYRDTAAARAAGHPGILAPPTFLFALELEQPDPFGYLGELGIDLSRVLHGEQSFTYHTPAYAGDTLTVTPRITDQYTKKGGSLRFVVKSSSVIRQDGVPIADLRSVLVVHDGTAGA